MATSAPEAEVSAMAEGFAASIFLFDSLKELRLVKGVGPSCILSVKIDSAVALKQLNTQSVTVRSRTAAQKLTYLRELVYQVSSCIAREDRDKDTRQNQEGRTDDVTNHPRDQSRCDMEVMCCDLRGNGQITRGIWKYEQRSSDIGAWSPSPQERRQYEWYRQAYLKSHLSKDAKGERENILNHGCIVSTQ